MGRPARAGCRRTRATEAAAARGATLADRPEPTQETEQGSSAEDHDEARRRAMAELRARLDPGREERADIPHRTVEGRPESPQMDNERGNDCGAAACRKREERENRQRDDRGRGGPER